MSSTIPGPASADSAALSGQSFSAAADQPEGYEHYRAMSGSAVVSVLLGVVSIVSLLPDFWILKVIPALGVIAGVTALVRIRRRSDELSGRKVALVGTFLSLAMLVAGTAWSAIVYATEIPDPKYQRIDYSMLKHPDEAKKNAISPAAQALDGKEVFLKGYMFPTQHQTGIVKFVLCRDNGDCCFGNEPPRSDMVLVELKKPLQATFSTGIRKVAGTFRIEGNHLGEENLDVLYRLEADYIK
jgi:hypothetical protein